MPVILPKVYRFSPSFKLWIYFCTLVLFACTLSIINLVFIDLKLFSHQPLTLILILAISLTGLSVYAATLWPKVHECIRLSDEEIVCRKANGKKIRIRWEDVQEVRDRRLLSRLEVHAAGPDRVIFVEHRIRGYAELLAILLEKLPPGTPVSSLHRQPAFASCEEQVKPIHYLSALGLDELVKASQAPRDIETRP